MFLLFGGRPGLGKLLENMCLAQKFDVTSSKFANNFRSILAGEAPTT